ncbi:beta-galactosidase GalB [Mucilaginibacter sp. PAMB04168]|uniref:beta-galactosidase GalB n=1 Tax=Mucilaginibacter sp. PAMB04168 TaxID=3138567 RepID=UPI0031F5FB4D
MLTAIILLFTSATVGHAQTGRKVENFNTGWTFHLGDAGGAEQASFKDEQWRKLNLPHDWSIEGTFSKDNPATPEGGALPGGIGWYRKTFIVPQTLQGKQVYIDFDGVYQKSTVWINGHQLGFRPNGYISFRYDLTPYLNFGGQQNVIAVKVDNSVQPNSRWYSGSGIYRNVWLVSTGKIAINHWGTYVVTPQVSAAKATIKFAVSLKNSTGAKQSIEIKTRVLDAAGATVAAFGTTGYQLNDTAGTHVQDVVLNNPRLWSTTNPYLYKAVTQIMHNKQVVDTYTTPLGIRYFSFDKDKGFFLNGKNMKLLGVCNHHDLGSLGAAVNMRALERQLEILKSMGVNAIRTSHNPPAPELLDLCDRMGFLVMDEAFDVWRKEKAKYDYHLYFDEWHTRDLADQLLRDRNHPSIIMWSVGNEIREQADSTGIAIAHDLARTVRQYDVTRPIVTANDRPSSGNFIVKSGEFELVGYNYHHREYEKFHETFPGKIFIGTETTSALETRGVYDMPSDSIRRWPNNKDSQNGVGTMNEDFTVSAYDNVSARWGSTHEETWKLIKKHDYLNSMFIWTGFDYLGEPTPYSWPARSSYFGVIDLAGFPKDIFYMYQAEWTSKPVLHIFPHWNWKPGKTVDVWSYYNNADEVELYLNGKSLGIRKKTGDDLHVMWRVQYQAGTLKAVSRKNGKVVLTRTINTAGAPARIELVADRKQIKADGQDLSFVTVRILDAAGNVVPDATNQVNFNLQGKGFIAGVDNGDPLSHDPFKANYRKAFHGLALAIIQSAGKQAGTITLTATADGLPAAKLILQAK